MTSCSFGIRNVQLTLLSLALCSSSFCFNIAAEPADERVYENTLKAEEPSRSELSVFRTGRNKSKRGEKDRGSRLPSKE